MDPYSSAEFATDCTSAEPKSALCEVLPAPTEVAILLGVSGNIVSPAVACSSPCSEQNRLLGTAAWLGLWGVAPVQRKAGFRTLLSADPHPCTPRGMGVRAG